MLSGRDTLQRIDRTLVSARDELTRVELELKRASEALTDNGRQRNRAVKRLAELRLESIARGGLVESLDAAELRAQKALQGRRVAMQKLEAEIESARQNLAKLEDERGAAHTRVEAVAQQLADLEAQVQRELDVDAGFQAQLEQTRARQAVALSAEEKTELADSDRQEKGQPYRADKLFSYLWARGYGTSAYQANLLARALDAWVARLCGYAEARANYYMLLEIPKRLDEHARAVREAADAEVSKLAELEQAAAEAAGVPQAQQQLMRAEGDQDRVDERIARAEAHLRELHEAEGGFASGEDEYVQQGLTVLAEAFARREVSELRRMARGTPAAEDDALVAEILDLREEEEDLQQELAEQRRMHGQHLERLKELEDVRRRFKHHRYDDLRSGFGNGDLVLMLLSEFLRGSVGGGGLWDALRRHQRYRDVGGAWPDFGSGGFGRPTRGGPWHWPGGRGGGFRLPRGGGSRSRGGGGFRTGGSF